MTTNKPEVDEHLKNLERITSEAVAEAYRLRRLWQFSASMIAASSSKIRPRGKDEERLIKLAKEADHGMAWAGTTDGWLNEALAAHRKGGE